MLYLPAAIMLFFDKFWQVQLPTEVAEAVVKTEAGRSSMQSFKELWLVKSSFLYSSHFNFHKPDWQDWILFTFEFAQLILWLKVAPPGV